MDFNQAKTAIGQFQRFFRALSTLDEVLTAALDARDNVTQAQNQLQMMEAEEAKLNNQMADLKPKLAKLKETYEDKLAKAEANFQDRQEQLEAEMNSKLEQKTDELEKLDIALEKAKLEHEKLLSQYNQEVEKVQGEVKYWESKLAEAKKAYEDFKEAFK